MSNTYTELKLFDCTNNELDTFYYKSESEAYQIKEEIFNKLKNGQWGIEIKDITESVVVNLSHVYKVVIKREKSDK